MDYKFQYDKRLRISIPVLCKNWSEYPENIQAEILLQWERERGRIPERIRELEKIIREKQTLLNHEEDFEKSCQLNAEIAELASIINDLWIWYRVNQVSLEEDSAYA